MLLAVASGKGGTGKTLISTNLARYWADQGYTVTYVDADVEEPNGHLFLNPNIEKEERCTVSVPTLSGRTCAAHGKCQASCAFNAILSVKGSVIVFNELCHGCGACILACPDNCLEEEDREIGTISAGTANGIGFISGRLDIGEARATPLIEAVIRQAEDRSGIVIIDAPPGTSCGAMAAVRRADLVLLVTEPTPFGLHDLELAVGMGRALGRDLSSVINRADLGNKKAKKYLEAQKIPILAEVPFVRCVAEAYAASRLPIEECDQFHSSIAAVSKHFLSP